MGSCATRDSFCSKWRISCKISIWICYCWLKFLHKLMANLNIFSYKSVYHIILVIVKHFLSLFFLLLLLSFLKGHLWNINVIYFGYCMLYIYTEGLLCNRENTLSELIMCCVGFRYKFLEIKTFPSIFLCSVMIQSKHFVGLTMMMFGKCLCLLNIKLLIYFIGLSICQDIR